MLFIDQEDIRNEKNERKIEIGMGGGDDDYDDY